VNTSEFEEIRQKVTELPSANATTRDNQPSLNRKAGEKRTGLSQQTLPS
jgi:hypothetical protein